MEIGDIVVRKSYSKDITFRIIDIKEEEGVKRYILKGINLRIIADSNSEDLERVDNNYLGYKDKILNFLKKSSMSIRVNVLHQLKNFF